MQGDFFLPVSTVKELGRDPVKEYSIIQAHKQLYHRFTEFATEIAQEIIWAHIRGDKELLKTAYNQLEDSASGKRFRCRGIDFTLAVETDKAVDLYGSNEFLMKTYMHERKSYMTIAHMADSLWKPWSVTDDNTYVKRQG